MQTGYAIRLIREKKGISAIEFSETIGIGRTYLSQIENNKRNPSKPLMVKICKALETDENIIRFLALSEDNIVDSKKESFKQIVPTVKQLIKDFYI